MTSITIADQETGEVFGSIRSRYNLDFGDVKQQIQELKQLWYKQDSDLSLTEFIKENLIQIADDAKWVDKQDDIIYI